MPLHRGMVALIGDDGEAARTEFRMPIVLADALPECDQGDGLALKPAAGIHLHTSGDGAQAEYVFRQLTNASHSDRRSRQTKCPARAARSGASVHDRGARMPTPCGKRKKFIRNSFRVPASTTS